MEASNEYHGATKSQWVTVAVTHDKQALRANTARYCDHDNDNDNDDDDDSKSDTDYGIDSDNVIS
jgi:hypothetical protein